MPSIEQNSNIWDGDYDWSGYGDEWSAAWGGPEAQWFGAIFPRIHAFLPTHTILEIAPGFGRWTQFLKDYCKRLIIVDLSERCIETCRKRFSLDSHIAYHINDGKSLNFIPGDSIDFVFSFDSLVHAETDAIEAYLKQLATKLKSNGIGFIHHSNLASYLDPLTKDLPTGFDNRHWRAKSVSAKVFEECCETVKLQCISQEEVNWGGETMNDVFSVFTRKESVWSRPNRLLRNPQFMSEATYISRLAGLYSIRVPAACCCPCCDAEFPAFLDWSDDYRNVVCPSCGSHPRHRLFWLFAKERGLLRGEKLKVLHFAPEPALRRLVSSSAEVIYTSADREQEGVDVLLDVTRLPCPDECVDVVLCSHVLNIVPEDGVALRELFRILRPGGWAWLQVSLDNARATTLEDPSVSDPRDRERLYTDEHNVRRYGRDFADKVRAAGFSFVEEDFTRKNLNPDQARRYGLDPAETLYFGTRDGGLGSLYG